MTEKMKIAMLAAATVIAAVALFAYCSPYQTCVRAATKTNLEADAQFQAERAQRDAEFEAQYGASLNILGPPEPTLSPPITEEEAERAAQLLCAKATA